MGLYFRPSGRYRDLPRRPDRQQPAAENRHAHGQNRPRRCRRFRPRFQAAKRAGRGQPVISRQCKPQRRAGGRRGVSQRRQRHAGAEVALCRETEKIQYRLLPHGHAQRFCQRAGNHRQSHRQKRNAHRARQPSLHPARRHHLSGQLCRRRLRRRLQSLESRLGQQPLRRPERPLDEHLPAQYGRRTEIHARTRPIRLHQCRRHGQAV